MEANNTIAVAQIAVMDTLRNEIRPRYKEVIEDSLAEMAQLMAATLSSETKADRLDARAMKGIFERIRAYPLRADINGVLKQGADFQIYVTDHLGKVVFDSEFPERVGEDYSKWNDVLLTLRGSYGARSTRLDPNDKLSSVMHVAAPVYLQGKIMGALTVRKAERAVESFLIRTLNNSTLYATFVFLLVFTAMVLLSALLTRPIKQLTEYAKKNRGTGRVPLPRFRLPEFRELGLAFEEMRIRLEGKKTIENFVQALTHELKSPLTAIRGAAELGLEDMPLDDRKKFLGNIRAESIRIQNIIEYLLEIASLESRTGLKNPESVDLLEVARECAKALEPVARAKNIRFSIADSSRAPVVLGERFLLFQAIRNLMQNALEHSEKDQSIDVEADKGENGWRLRILNRGEPIPDYAQDRVFEKFYSLEKPDTAKKSSGLGLSFSREVAALHAAELLVRNRSDGLRGVEAALVFSFKQDVGP